MSTESTGRTMDTNLEKQQNRASDQEVGDRAAMQTPPPIPKQRKRKRLGCMLTGIIVGLFLLVGLFKVVEPVIVLVRYQSNAVPCLGMLRMKIELYRIKQSYLPGMLLDTNGVPIEVAPPVMSPEGGTSHLGVGYLTQAFHGIKDQEGIVRYEPVMLNIVTNRGMHPGYAELSADASKHHFSRKINIEYADMIGANLRPSHVLYWCPMAEYHTGSYTYALGIFGNDDGLSSGTGYALLEINNPSVEQRIVVAWERWYPVVANASQIVFVSPDENADADPATAASENYCWVPSKAAITTDDPVVFAAMFNDLRKAGWQ